MRTTRAGGRVLGGLVAGALVLGSATSSWAMPTNGPVHQFTCGDAAIVVQGTAGDGLRIWGEDGTRYLIASFDMQIYRGDFATEPDNVTPIFERSQTFGNRTGHGEVMACSFRDRNPDHNATAFIDVTVTTKH